MRKLVAAGSVVVAGALAPVVVNVAPASAETKVIRDAVGDDKTGSGNGDIAWMRVDYGAHRVRIKIKSPRSGNVEHIQDIYVDVRRKDSTPDLVIGTNGDVEGWAVGFVDDWKLGGYRSRCVGGDHSSVYDYARHFVRFSVPISCLMRKGAEQPKRIRVALVARTEWGADYDWVPDRHTFGPWIAWT